MASRMNKKSKSSKRSALVEGEWRGDLRDTTLKVYGEGPSTQAAEKGQFDGQKDVSDKPFTAEDIRFTQPKDGKMLYAVVLNFRRTAK